MRLRTLPRSFFDRDPRRVARGLLGKLLVRRSGRRLRAGRIVEVEVYLAEKDPAAHAFRGPTPRNRVLFGPPGHAYVYLIYGAHFCLNVSCLPPGNAGCVLLRALEPVAGLEEMARARKVGLDGKRALERLTSGPGRLCQALGVTRARDNGKDFTRSDLTIAEDGFRPRRIAVTPRIGIRQAARRPLRYLIAGNTFVSPPRPQRTPRRKKKGP
ncbi:MAG TPA: DNA-3-methyladenine glycosylase [Myxococcales bacterium]|nr:DNA-3-methyladenine glycosylase [Myxococcales bacterium]